MTTRDAILDGALEVMRARGLARTTTKEIARASGFSEATLDKLFTGICHGAALRSGGAVRFGIHTAGGHRLRLVGSIDRIHRDALRCRIPTQIYDRSMKSDQLDIIDRKLVHALLIAPRAPFRQLAATLGVSDQTVRRRYSSLSSSLGLQVLGRLDSGLVGRVDWILRLQCTPDAAVAVGSALARRPDTSWVRLASGGTEIHCLFQPRGPRERDNLLLDRLTGSRRVLQVSAHQLLHTFSAVAWHEFTRALAPDELASLRADAAGTDPRSEENSGASVQLSEQDEALAALLAKDGRATAAALAAGTGWHEATVRRRIAQLQRAGALYFDIDLDERVLGGAVSAELWISAEPRALIAVGTAIAAHPEVAFAGATTGPTNLLVSVVCADTGHLFRYLTTEIGELPGIRHIETAPAIRTLKRGGSAGPG